jgi:hypothetical protein
MKKRRLWFPILLSVLVLMLGFSVYSAEARGESFTIETMKEAVENVTLGVSDQVVGNLKIINGSVDFLVTGPNGAVVLSFPNVSDISFNFTAVENGMYSMRLNNTCQASSVIVELDYRINVTVNLQAGINVGSSLGVAQVVAPAIRPSPPDIEDDEQLQDYVVEPFLNLLRASDILNQATGARVFLPISNLTLISGVASLLGLTFGMSVRRRKPLFPKETFSQFKKF